MAKKTKAPATATPENGPLVVIANRKNYRPGTARAVWYDALLAYEGKPVAEFVAHVTANPPSLPTKGKNAGVPEKASGWLSHFRKDGVLAEA
jgi:hypothetical protein